MGNVYIGVNNIAKKVSNIYVGVNNIARQVSKAYVGVSNIAREFYSSNEWIHGAINLPAKLSELAATTLGNYALFGGGYSGSNGTNGVHVYDISLTQGTTLRFDNLAYGLAATTVGNLALFGGGAYKTSTKTNYLSNLSKYDSSLTYTKTSLGEARSYPAATTVGNYALFGGGYRGSNSTRVDSIDKSGTIRNVTALSNGGFVTATTVGNYALFAGGSVANVDTYDSSLTKGTASDLSEWRYFISATTVGNYALFAGGNTSTSMYNSSTLKTTVDTYNTSLTKGTATNLSAAVSGMAATTVGNYALFAGGRGLKYGDNRYNSNIVNVYNTSLTKDTIDALTEGRVDFAATTVGTYALFGGGDYITNLNGERRSNIIDYYQHT